MPGTTLTSWPAASGSLQAAARRACLKAIEGTVPLSVAEAAFVEAAEAAGRDPSDVRRVVIDAGPGTHDGFRVDVDGNLWCGWGMGAEGLDGVHVFNPEGRLIGRIDLPERVGVGAVDDRITVAAGERGARLMILGGATFNGPRYIWWNFVASSAETTSFSAPRGRVIVVMDMLVQNPCRSGWPYSVRGTL